MAPNIRNVRANNPSPLTGTGTNTYLLGTGEVAVIDPGPDMDRHLGAILATLEPDERITTILLTHAHLDHSALIPRLVAATGATVLAFGPADSGRSAGMIALAGQGLTSDEGADQHFSPDRRLIDGDQVAIGGLTVETLHLPGHMGCHIGFAVGDVLFSGDHVMQWSTTLVSPPDGEMAAYMASLRRLTERKWSHFLPGHGPQVEAPATRLAELIQHRMKREEAILVALYSLGPATPTALAARIYTETPSALLPAATRNVLSHLIDLVGQGRVGPGPGPLATTEFHHL